MSELDHIIREKIAEAQAAEDKALEEAQAAACDPNRSLNDYRHARMTWLFARQATSRVVSMSLDALRQDIDPVEDTDNE